MAVDETLVERLRESLKLDPGIVFAYLFGSQGRGDAGPRSDVDVAVYLRAGANRDVLRIMDIIEGVGRKRHLDVVILNDAPPSIAYAALEGLLLFSHDETQRVNVESRIAAEYLDREPSMARHLDEVVRVMSERGFG